MSPLLRAAVLLVLLASASATAAEDPPAFPKEIAVPAGYTPVLTARAKGVQIYRSVEGKDGKLEWVLEAPLAELTNAKGEPIGLHFGGPPFGGPAWEAADGSRLVRDKAQDVKSAPAPKAGTDLPWLLVRVKADSNDPGAFAKVAYIQRVLTEGGLAPAAPPKRADTRLGASYRATYVFYAPAK
jgi:hypothetical protein